MQFGPDLSGNGIPIVDITIGYNTELITSQTSTTSGLSGSTEQTVTNNTTTATYGGRTRTYSGTANTSDSEALQVSGFWTNRQAIARSTPLEVTTTLAAIDADQTAVPAQVAALFDFGDSLYQVASTSFTATGGVYITTDQITTRRRISATPSNTTITVVDDPGR
jgi:phospholipase/lecithinase/hemolysin